MCAWDEIVVSLTHNFVDATNLADVLADATRAINDELLPMSRSLTPKRVLRTLAKALKIPEESLRQTLLELPDLACDAHIEEAIACAAAGAEGDDEQWLDEDYNQGPEGVAALLRAELEVRLKAVRPAFEAAAVALRDALKLRGDQR